MSKNKKSLKTNLLSYFLVSACVTVVLSYLTASKVNAVCLNAPDAEGGCCCISGGTEPGVIPTSDDNDKDVTRNGGTLPRYLWFNVIYDANKNGIGDGGDFYVPTKTTDHCAGQTFTGALHTFTPGADVYPLNNLSIHVFLQNRTNGYACNNCASTLEFDDNWPEKCWTQTYDNAETNNVPNYWLQEARFIHTQIEGVCLAGTTTRCYCTKDATLEKDECPPDKWKCTTSCIGGDLNIKGYEDLIVTLNGLPANLTTLKTYSPAGKCGTDGRCLLDEGDPATYLGYDWQLFTFLIGEKGCEISVNNPSINEGGVGDITVTKDSSGALQSISSVTFQEGSGLTVKTPSIPVNWNGSESPNPYKITVSAESINVDSDKTYSYTVTATDVNSITCSKSGSITVKNSAASWWQVEDADVWSMGNLGTRVVSPNIFNLKGSGGYPGVNVYNGVTDLTTNTISDNTNARWLANSTFSGTTASYDDLYNLASTHEDLNPVTDDSDFVASADSNGYEWYYANNDFTLGTQNFGSRKIILFVGDPDGPKNVTINGDISTNDGTGLFLVIANGNINISSDVTSLEGIYIGSRIYTNAENTLAPTNRLDVRGSVIASDVLDLGRDLGNANNTLSSEKFTFAADMFMNLPTIFRSRNTSWKEVAP